MPHTRLLVVAVVTVLLAGACGKSDEELAAEKAAEETREAAEALKNAAESAEGAGAADGLREFAKAMEGAAAAMAGTAPDGKTVEPLPFQDLQTALPELSGWERGSPRGDRMTAPVPFSEAETDYSRNGTNVSMKIVDSAFNQLLVAPWAMFLTTGYEREGGDGYEKAMTLDGNPGFERWNKSGRRGELNLVVAKRFLVTIEGENIDNTKVLYEFASKLDTGMLASLK